MRNEYCLGGFIKVSTRPAHEEVVGGSAIYFVNINAGRIVESDVLALDGVADGVGDGRLITAVKDVGDGILDRTPLGIER